jgi:hypothetical protein
MHEMTAKSMDAIPSNATPPAQSAVMPQNPYWASEDYLSPVCSKLAHYAAHITDTQNFPLIILQNGDMPKHIACAPGFLSPTNAHDMAILLNNTLKAAKEHTICTAFLQYRCNDLNGLKNALKTITETTHIDKRTTITIDLTRSEEELLKACRKDTRNRLRQIPLNVLTHDLICHSDFHALYETIANNNDFSCTYRYSKTDIDRIQSAPGIIPVSVYENRDIYVGGAILGHVNETTCDYIISAYDTNHSNSGRAILWQSLIAAKSLGYKTINLGGGVKENDSLQSFKTSFGGDKMDFYTVKIIFDLDTYCAAYGADMTKINLDGRFPPILSKNT